MGVSVLLLCIQYFYFDKKEKSDLIEPGREPVACLLSSMALLDLSIGILYTT